MGQEDLFGTDIPVLSMGASIDMKDIRDPWEKVYLYVIWMTNVICGLVVVGLVLSDIEWLITLAFLGFLFWTVSWVSWKLLFSYIYGNSIEITASQYPQIYQVVKQASELLNIAVPTVLIMQGHGMFELFVAKRFTRRGFIILTSNMVDEFAKRPTSRELMMFVGMQLGHIKAGHFDYWFFKDVVGYAALLFHTAWKRRCRLTADRIGLLTAGKLYAAEQALFMITAGARIATGTNYDAIVEQRTKLFESIWAWVRLGFSTFPYTIDRIVRLREFAASIGRNGPAIGALPIEHTSIKASTILIIHGHDRLALLELKDFLYSRFPQIMPRVMVDAIEGAASLPEKFEMVASDVVGAIALLTPDDMGRSISERAEGAPRARQNVVMEIGWVWGKLGRDRFLLLARGNTELPSDLSGVQVLKFHTTPQECSEAVRLFIGRMIAPLSEDP
jgi:Zn-dependent protease with chaperone function